jgi:uncharacterized protein (DUF2147 family)
VRDRIQLIAGSPLSSYLSDPADPRGQAIGLFGQTLVQCASAERYGEAFIALGATIVVTLCGILLFKYGKRQAGQSVDMLRAAVARWRSGLSVVAAMFMVAGRQAPAALVAIFAIGLATASAQPASSPVGDWATANGHGVIAIAQCGEALCGRIVGIDRKPTEPMPTDVDGRPQCGLTIITGERSQPDGTWLGQVTDPRSGGVYGAKLWLDAQGNLRLRGFIGIPALGATQTWHRYTGHLTGACSLV